MTEQCNINESRFIKEHIIDTIKTEMYHFIDKQQMHMLINALSKAFSNIKVEKENYELSTEVDTNEKILKTFLASKAVEGLRRNTLNAYEYTIRTFFETVNMDYRDVDTTVIRTYLAICEKRMQKVSINNIRRNLNTFFSWVSDEGYIDHPNPCKKIKPVKFEKRIKKPLTDVEIERIRDSCADKRELAIIDLLLSTGIRREELTNIKLTDVDFTGNEIKIFGKGAKERIVYMSPRCRLHLLDYLHNRNYDSPYLFCSEKKHSKLSKEGLCFIMRRIGERAAVDNCQVHRIRKWFASDLGKKGCDIIYIQKLLGHESIETTKTYYITIEQNMVRNEHGKYVA